MTEQVNCDTCKMLVNTAISWADAGDTPELMAEKYTTLCAALNIASEHVCRGMGEMRSVIMPRLLLRDDFFIFS